MKSEARIATVLHPWMAGPDRTAALVRSDQPIGSDALTEFPKRVARVPDPWIGPASNARIELPVTRTRRAEYAAFSRTGGRFLTVLTTFYIVAMPFTVVAALQPVSSFVGAVSTSASFLLHVVGISYIGLQSQPWRATRQQAATFTMFIGVVFVLITTSVGMALYIQFTRGDWAGTSALEGVVGQIVYFIHYALILYFNMRVLSWYGKAALRRAFVILISALWVVGVCQALAIVLGGPFSELLGLFDALGVLMQSEDVLNMGRIPLTGSEPAEAGVVIGVVVMPYLMSQVLTMGWSMNRILVILAWVPIVYMTYSSTAFLLVTVNAAMFFLLSLMRKAGPFGNRASIGGAIGFGLVVFVALFALRASELWGRFEYLIINKFGDENNMSSVSRIVPIEVNWQVFLNYPIFGVGNGNQGYFYVEYFPNWARSSLIAPDLLDRARVMLVNGSLFIPSILSGYGILGSLLLLIFFVKLLRLARDRRRQLEFLYPLFLISFGAVVLAGFQMEFAGSYLVWTVLSIPLLVFVEEPQLGKGERT